MKFGKFSFFSRRSFSVIYLQSLQLLLKEQCRKRPELIQKDLLSLLIFIGLSSNLHKTCDLSDQLKKKIKSKISSIEALEERFAISQRFKFHDKIKKRLMESLITFMQDINN